MWVKKCIYDASEILCEIIQLSKKNWIVTKKNETEKRGKRKEKKERKGKKGL